MLLGTKRKRWVKSGAETLLRMVSEAELACAGRCYGQHSLLRGAVVSLKTVVDAQQTDPVWSTKTRLFWSNGKNSDSAEEPNSRDNKRSFPAQC
jgi:hypothetical protein